MRWRVPFGAVLAVGLAAVAWWARSDVRSMEPVDPVAAAWAAVTARPQDPATWTRLGEIQQEADALPAAEHAFRTALALGDASGLAYARLGFLLYGQGEDREARQLLREAKRRGAEVPMLDSTLAALAASLQEPDPGQGPPPSTPRRPGGAVDAGRPEAYVPEDPAHGNGSVDASVPTPAADCRVPLRREGRGVFLVDVRIDGVEGAFVLDTGASITVLTEDFAARARLRLDPEASVDAVTANGRVRMPTTELGALELGAFRTEGVRAAVCASCMESLADGLLGLDVQARLRIELDLANGAARFGGCE